MVERFRDGYLPYQAERVKDYFESLKARVDPDVVFTPYRGDWHQDHRFVAELTWSTFRDHMVLAAGPTLTIVALALRLAWHIRQDHV